MRALARHQGALLGLALFLVAGLAVLDDYGVHWDENFQRRNAEANLGYLADGDFRAYTSALYADVKEPCEQEDTNAKFFLHIRPEQVADLPEERRESGFDNLDFDFFSNGALFDGKCAARVPLPEYPIASIRTGQHAGGAGEIWSAEFAGPSLR